MRISVLTVTIALVSTTALATEAPNLPKSAKKLSGAEIEVLYKDASLSGSNFEGKSLLSFKVKTNTAKMSIVGNWSTADGASGQVDLTYRIRGDQWCYKPTSKNAKETCVAVYSDGSDIYEVKKGSHVSSKNAVSY